MRNDLIKTIDLSANAFTMLKAALLKHRIFDCSLDTILSINWLIPQSQDMYIEFPTPLKYELMIGLCEVRYFISDFIKPNLMRIPGMTFAIKQKLESADIITDWMLLNYSCKEISRIIDDPNDLSELTDILLKNDLTWRDCRIFTCGNCGKKSVSHYSHVQAYCDECTERFKKMIDIEGYRLYLNYDSVDIINLSDELLEVSIEDFYIRYENKDHDKTDCIIKNNITILPQSERTIIELDNTFDDYNEPSAYIVIQIDDYFFKFTSDGSQWMYEAYFE